LYVKKRGISRRLGKKIDSNFWGSKKRCAVGKNGKRGERSRENAVRQKTSNSKSFERGGGKKGPEKKGD